MKNIIWLVIVVVIIGGLVWWGTANDSTAPAAETGPVKIGVITPSTGDAAVYAEPARRIIQMAADEINAIGGVVDGRLIEFIFEMQKESICILDVDTKNDTTYNF